MSVLPRRTLDALAPPSTYVTRTLRERFTCAYVLHPPPSSKTTLTILSRLALHAASYFLIHSRT